MKPVGLLLCLWVLSAGTAEAQTEQDKATVRGLPQAFSDAFNKHDGHQLALLMAEDVDFVTVGLNWLHGRADFEKYHTRLLTGRFKENVNTVLETHVRFIRPDLALVRSSWTAQGDRNVDGSARPQRYGLMTMLAEKQNGAWLIVAVQNTNGPTGPNTSPLPSPELEGIKSPLVVPRAKQ